MRKWQEQPAASRPTDVANQSDLLDSHVVPASHVMPAAEIALNRPQLAQQAGGIDAPGANRSAGNEPTDRSNGAPEQISEPSAAQAAPAAQPVEYYIARALQTHPRIAAARLRVAAASHEIPQARALPDPMWNNTFWPITDNALQTAGGRIAHQMSLQQQVPWPEKLRARAAIASREVEVARAELERVERAVGCPADLSR